MNSSIQQSGTVSKHTKTSVTCETEQPSDLSGGMAVVNRETRHPTLFRGWVSTYLADSTLLFKKLMILFGINREAVSCSCNTQSAAKGTFIGSSTSVSLVGGEPSEFFGVSTPDTSPESLGNMRLRDVGFLCNTGIAFMPETSSSGFVSGERTNVFDAITDRTSLHRARVCTNFLVKRVSVILPVLFSASSRSLVFQAIAAIIIYTQGCLLGLCPEVIKDLRGFFIVNCKYTKKDW